MNKNIIDKSAFEDARQMPRKPCAHLSQQILEGRTVAKRVCNTCHKVLENIPYKEGSAE